MEFLFSDKDTQFLSHQFKQFAKLWDFMHQTLSSEYLQSNGLAEQNIQTVKRILKKLFKSRTDPYMALLNFNTTPNTNGQSPAFDLMNRKLQITLPSFITEEIKDILPRKQKARSKNLPEISPKTFVRIH